MRNAALAIVALGFIAASCAREQSSDASTTKQPARAGDDLEPSKPALDLDCSGSGDLPDGGTQFIVSCPLASTSPDANWTLKIGEDAGEGVAPVSIRSADAKHEFAVPELSDGMPFVLMWSPRPNWFLVNHHVGSFMDRPEVYEITEKGAVAHDKFRIEGLRLARAKFACLPRAGVDWASGSAIRWSKDGTKIAWVFITRTDMCSPDWGGKSVPDREQWRPFLMISDVHSGEIVPRSVRIIGDDLDKFEMPHDGPYRTF